MGYKRGTLVLGGLCLERNSPKPTQRELRDPAIFYHTDLYCLSQVLSIHLGDKQLFYY
ncbi:hypothetical protein GXM_02023 [Nostoc sphaeroides CCNUC1]|uniref:Uncharacterized protein n=1 Tax=Nostoc sphaeroides CCNUC1 TaxID=2653204 RepID=A0A5P8VVV0_9NOSO|nr:hypothetical protein GXM_02023 [Nostoc sphaeroides CCNUC1]